MTEPKESLFDGNTSNEERIQRDSLKNDDGLLEEVNKKWRTQAYRAMRDEITAADNYAGRDLDKRQDAWVYRKRELGKLEDFIGGWEAFQMAEMLEFPSSMHLPIRNQLWAKDSRVRDELPLPDNDWTWLSSVLSNPEAFQREQFWKYRGKHIAVFRRKVWAANERARVAEEEATVAIRAAIPEILNFNGRHQIVLYFLG